MIRQPSPACAARMRRVASRPSISGIRMSISTTSGRCRSTAGDRLRAVGGLGHHVDARRRRGSSGTRCGPASGRRRSAREARFAQPRSPVAVAVHRDPPWPPGARLGVAAALAATGSTGKPGPDLPAAARHRPGVQLARRRGRPARAGRAGRGPPPVTARAAAGIGGPASATSTIRLAVLAVQADAGARLAGVLEHVGQRFLHDPERGQVQAGRQRRRGPGRRGAARPAARRRRPGRRARWSWPRPGCGRRSASSSPSIAPAPARAEQAEQVPQLGHRRPAAGLHGQQRRPGLARRLEPAPAGPRRPARSSR